MENELDRKVQLLNVEVLEAKISNTNPSQPISQSKMPSHCEHWKNNYSQLKALTIRNLIVYKRHPM